MSGKYDVVVIGAGLAGLSVAGLLARDEKKKVLVLERDRFLGGRMLSFRGKGNKIVTHMGEELDEEGFKRSLVSVYSWFHDSRPDISTILEKKLLDGYGWECGGTVTFWGDNGRMAALLDHFGKHLPMSSNKGFVVITEGGKKKYQIRRGVPYGWMSDEQNKTVKTLLRELSTADEDTALKWEGVSLDQWLRRRTNDQGVYEYIAAVASIHMVMGEPANISMRDFGGFMRAAVRMGVNLLTGGATGVMPDKGFGTVALRLADVVQEHGGEIRLNTNVEEVLFEGNKAYGVELSSRERIGADQVVCTLPTRDVFNVIPKEKFPQDFVASVEKNFFSTGMLTAFYGFKGNLLLEHGIDPGSWGLAPSILKAEEGFIGDVDIIATSKSNWEPTLAPVGRGEHSMGLSIALLDHEIRQKELVKKVIKRAKEVMYTAYPRMQEMTVFELWLCSYRGYGDWPPANMSRPPITQPEMQNVFFAGDGYGPKVWGAGMDAAVHSALFCAEEISGRSYVRDILPEHHR